MDRQGHVALSTDLADDDIPRYPPFAKGLPVAPIDKVLATQRELIERIRSTLGYTTDEFESLVVPVLERYAGFVHLLPASEAHHHRGAGGLFRHGLEVAFWAAQASEAVIFSMEGSPRERRMNEPRWRLATCFAGLLHDVGKPLSDVSVTDQKGGRVWNPYTESLVSWARSNNVDRYFIRWRSKRHKRHEQFSLLTIERILTPEVLAYLSAAGPEIVEAMLEAVAGTGIHQPVTRLMLQADQESVSRDLRQSRLAVDEFSYGVPVERYVLDAIRRLIKTDRWKVNEPGARVWHLHQGVFIAWKQGISDLHELLQNDGIPGVPRDPDTLADILIERGFALPNQVQGEGEGAYYRYWEVLPEMLHPVKLLMLRLESPELIFTTEPPRPVAGEVVGAAKGDLVVGAATEVQSGELSNNASSTSIPTPQAQQQATVAPQPPTGEVPDVGSLLEILSESKSADEPTPEKNDAPAQTSDKAVTSVTPDKQPQIAASNPLEALAGLTANLNSTGMDFPFAGFGVNAPEDGPTTAKNELTMKTAAEDQDIPGSEAASDTKPSRRRLTTSGKETVATKPQGGATPAAAPKAPNTQSSAREELERHLSTLGGAGALLRQAILPVLEGEAMLGEVLCLLDGTPVILYPEGARSLGEQPAQVMAILFDAGAITPDPVMPGRKVRDFNGIKALALSEELGGLVLAAIREVESILDADLTAPTAPKKPTPSPVKKNKRKRELREPQPQQQPEHPKRDTKKAEPAPAAEAKQTQNLARLPKREVPQPAPAVPAEATQPEPATPEFVLAALRDDEAAAPTKKPITPEEEAALLPPKITPEHAISELKEMLRKRKGRWLVTPVVEENGFLVTSDKALERIAGDYPELLSKHVLRGQIGLDRSRPMLRVMRGKLMMKAEEA